MKTTTATLLAAVAISVPAIAQIAAPRLDHPNPSDPKFRVPPAVYSSPFARYRPLGDESVARWKETNDTVEKAGGWLAYLKEGRAA
ncbi:MAG: hypothetical protein ACREIB_10860, partial [Pseudomonadota bacterium]